MKVSKTGFEQPIIGLPKNDIKIPSSDFFKSRLCSSEMTKSSMLKVFTY